MKLTKRIRLSFFEAEQILGPKWEIDLHLSSDYRHIQALPKPTTTNFAQPVNQPAILLLNLCFPDEQDLPSQWQIQIKRFDGPVLKISTCKDTQPRLDFRHVGRRLCSLHPCPGQLCLEFLDGYLARGQIFCQGEKRLMHLKKSSRLTPIYLPKCLWQIIKPSVCGDDLESIYASIARASYYRVASLAELFQISERQLERVHIQTFGETPKAWLERYRIQEARRLLQDGFKGPACADQLGFSHPNHFYRWHQAWERRR